MRIRVTVRCIGGCWVCRKKIFKKSKNFTKTLDIIYIYIYNVHVIDYEIYNLKINIEKG